MAIFVIGDDDVERIKQAMAKARMHPITREMLERFAKRVAANDMGRQLQERVEGDRPKSIPEPQQVLLPFGWRLAISYEEQPDEPCWHLSMSSPTPQQTLPRIEALEMVVTAMGYDIDTLPSRTWIEGYKEGSRRGEAVNMIFPVVPLQKGNA